ncbi:winged helix DNA-binding protein [Acidisoma sp. S159]|uniref:winged helix DNA-binding protein n=1 Tax=Acidisoma sp. S159 TaxID=1747225 RepID=UPI00352A31A5
MRSFAALLITHTSEQSTTTTSIAQALNVPLGASSFAIDRLVAEKLVKRVSDKADRRVFHLRLTSSGRALCRNLVKAPNSGSHFE